MMTPVWIIGFSGHRRLTPEQETAAGTALAGIFAELESLATGQKGRCELYSGIAWGADQVAIRKADAAGMPVHLILPRHVDEAGDGGFAADFREPGMEKPEAWAYARERIAAAEAGRNCGSCRLVPGTERVPECYYDAGLQVLSACDVLVAVWNGRPAEGIGGTEQWITQARRLEIPLIYFNPETGVVHRERMEQFACDAGTHIISRMSATAAEAVDSEGTPAERMFRRLDLAAARLGREFRHSLVWSIVLHGVATTVAAGAAVITSRESPWKGILIALAVMEAAILLWIMWRQHRLHKGHVHPAWIETRFAAELLRSQLAAGPLLDPLHPLIANHHHPEWRRFALAAGLMVHRGHSLPPDVMAARLEYVARRLRDPDPLAGQIAHYRTQQKLAEHRFRRFLRWGRFFTGLATWFVIGALLLKIYKAITGGAGFEGWPAILIVICFSLFPIIFPLAGGVLVSLRSALDTGRRTYRYRQLAHRLETAASAIEALATPAAVRRAVAGTEDMLLDELIEWRLAEEQNGGH